MSDGTDDVAATGAGSAEQGRRGGPGAPDRPHFAGSAAERFAAVWAGADELTEAELLAAVDTIAAEDPDDPRSLAERGGARDAVGREAEAEGLYRAAIAAGLAEPELGQVVIQLASTLRNLGRPDEAVTLLRGHFDTRPEHELASAASAFLALALRDLGRADDALATALRALAPSLPRYTRSVLAYADELGARSTPEPRD